MSSTIEPKTATPTMPVRPEIAEPVEVAEKPRRRRWIWIVVAIVAVLAVVGAYVFVNVTSSTILDENFNGGSGTFPTETTANLETTYVNEAYQVTVTTPPASPAYPYVQLNDSVDAMNLQADVSIPTDAPAGTYAGVMAMTSTSQGYMLVVGVDGSVVLIKALNLESSDRNAWFQLPPMILRPAGTVTVGDQPVTVRLEIAQQSGKALVTPVIDGTTIGTASDFEPYTAFSVIGLFPDAMRAGQVFTFDNVLATKGTSS